MIYMAMNNKKITYSPLFRTKCQFIASTLFALGKKIDSTEWDGRECFFLFENESVCREIMNKYYSGGLKVDPRILFDSFKTIKSMIFNNN